MAAAVIVTTMAAIRNGERGAITLHVAVGISACDCAIAALVRSAAPGATAVLFHSRHTGRDRNIDRQTERQRQKTSGSNGKPMAKRKLTNNYAIKLFPRLASYLKIPFLLTQ